jgi:hypothetical protein
MLEDLFTFQWRENVRGLRVARWITRTHQAVLEALQACMASGDDAPSHADLAALAECSERAVGRCLKEARAQGMVAWERRGHWTREGWRRITNAYELLRRTAPIEPRPRPVCEPNGQIVRARKASKVSKAYRMMVATPLTPLAAIAARIVAADARRWYAATPGRRARGP